MGTITVINENGEMEKQEVVNRGIAISYDSQGETKTLEPAVGQRVEYDHSGAMSQIMTVCGETENRREGDEKPDITAEGIIVKNELEEMKRLHEGQEITFVSDVDKGDVIIQRLTIEQKSNLVHFTPDGGEQELAFTFHLQLKRPE